MNLEYQLVIQFSATTLDEYDVLIELEAALVAEKEMSVDGHDFGMGEFNIFIHTNEPETTFELAAELVDTFKPGIPFSAGYRKFTEEDYISLWPATATSFCIA
jgi:hypothetical protein